MQCNCAFAASDTELQYNTGLVTDFMKMAIFSQCSLYASRIFCRDTECCS